MGPECIGAVLKDDSAVILSAPPGFAPLPSFTLQRIQDDVKSSCPDSTQNHMDVESDVNSEKFKKSLRHRPWVNYRQFDDSSEEEEFDPESYKQDVPSIRPLPKGVLRGCAQCVNCQKVTAKWRPEHACRPVLEEAPVFYPTEEEFKDTLKYIASIRQRAESYGICRIVPPASWSPPCLLKENSVWGISKFVTRIQQVDKLQNRDSMKKGNHSVMKRKRRKLSKMVSDSTSTTDPKVEEDGLGYYKYAERFGFEPGPGFTLELFQKYADDFKEQYFCMKDMDVDLRSEQWEPSVENIEGEYWRIVEKPTEEIEVLYGADLETGDFGSGFPKRSAAPASPDLEDSYVESGWNLNNFPRLPGSLLSFESGDISGVLVPWLYIGMCFSSFCWHVEDHHFYSLNYMHWGAPKVWYGVPGRDALKFERAMKKHLAELFEEQPDLLHNLVTQFSPSRLNLEGVPVYRCVQRSGEFVLTFPRSYHSGFNCGFNCAEAVNVAPIDWLPHGQNAVELYREEGRKISISHDKLLLGAAREAVRAQWNILFLKKNTLDNSRWKYACGPDGVLAKALKTRIEMEGIRREYLCCSSQSRKMHPSFDSSSERECVICHYDLHLSAAACPCSPDKFACLVHAKQLCYCPWKARFFLFRYEISEMNVLVDAVGGKLSAVHKWGLSDLGLSLSSCVTKERSPESKNSSEITKGESGPVNQCYSVGGARSYSISQEIKPFSSDVPKDKEKKTLDIVCAMPAFADLSSQQRLSATMTTSTSKEPCVQGSSLFRMMDSQCLQSTKGEKSSDLSSSGSLDQQPSQESNSVLMVDKSLSSGNKGAMLTKDGEHERPDKLILGNIKEEPFLENSEASARLKSSDDKVTSCNSNQDQVLVTPETNASAMNEKDIDLQPILEKSGSLPNLVPLKAKIYEDEGTCRVDGLSNLQNQQSSGSSYQSRPHALNSGSIPVAKPVLELAAKEADGSNIRSVSSHIQNSLLSGIGRTSGDMKDRNESDSAFADSGNLYQKSSSNISNSLDRNNRPLKGPRMAKVVRRVNCNAEPLEYGVVLSGKLWSTSKVIFPKGYRSRVKYLSILDPTQMCNYISEILDAGLLGPLFMVTLEQCPSEVFIHVSATKCWDMVRERVNNEIRRQHSLGKVNLPSFQPPGSLDGLEMFGLSSPRIIQGIEAIDQKRVCTEYWRSRSNVQTSSTPSASSLCQNLEEFGGNQDLPLLPGTSAALTGLFKKGNLDELLILHGILRSDKQNVKEEVIQLLNKEAQGRSN